MNEVAAGRPTTLILIPARNEASRIPAVLRGIRAALGDAAVLVVEDGSTDDTADVARRHGARVVSLPVNLGYGGALRTGFQYAFSKGYARVITLDADGQHDPADLPAISRALDDADLVIGSRFLGTAAYSIPLARRVGMALFSVITTTVVRKKITDTTSGFMGVGTRALPVVARTCAVDFPNAELICEVARAGLRLAEVPVTIRERENGRSLFNFWTATYYPFKLLLAVSMVLIREKDR
jgi:hypothetical protein